MSQTLFIISLATQKILPYQYQPTDTFAPIIADLQAQGQPANLLYYNGIESIPIVLDYHIEPFFPQRRNQVIIYAFEQPKEPFPLLTVPADHILVLILKWDLSQLIPLYLPPNTTIEEVINYFQTTYGWIVSLTRQTGRAETVLLDRSITLAEVLPERTEQILLKLEDQSLVVHQIAQLQDLPNELVIQVLLQLPIASLTTICRLSKRLAHFCHDEGLWHQLVVRDFGLQTKSEQLTWRVVYKLLQQIKAQPGPKTKLEVEALGRVLTRPTSQDLRTNLANMFDYLNFSLQRDMIITNFYRQMSDIFEEDQPKRFLADSTFTEVPLDDEFLNLYLGQTTNNQLRLILPRVHSASLEDDNEIIEIPIANNRVIIRDIVNAIMDYTRNIPYLNDEIFDQRPWGDNIYFEGFVYDANRDGYLISLG